jgi:hypothetical protein
MQARSWFGIGTLLAVVGCSTDDIPNDYEAIVGRAGTTSAGGGSSGEEDLPLPPAQGVLWLDLASADGGACSSMGAFEEPGGAEVTLTAGIGERVVDGAGGAVACRVRPSPAANDFGFDLDLALSSGSVSQFRASGSVKGTYPSVTVELATGSGSLAQLGCTANARDAVPGAAWFFFSCDALVDPSAPGIVCAAEGGVIFENCATE